MKHIIAEEGEDRGVVADFRPSRGTGAGTIVQLLPKMGF